MKMRNKVIAASGVAATAAGAGAVLVASASPAGAAAIIIDPIIAPLLHLLVVLGL